MIPLTNSEAMTFLQNKGLKTLLPIEKKVIGHLTVFYNDSGEKHFEKEEFTQLMDKYFLMKTEMLELMNNYSSDFRG
ncbi:unnamed protein product [Moneuplotes crassus]|uniref:Uncharacterized protein n=1 Tax=Euplotes crassus TaxID=5936 RepID=A0AAD1U6S9_EUPCR|nr:unnamed protein product [Moneuplotes crassus]